MSNNTTNSVIELLDDASARSFFITLTIAAIIGYVTKIPYDTAVGLGLAVYLDNQFFKGKIRIALLQSTFGFLSKK